MDGVWQWRKELEYCCPSRLPEIVLDNHFGWKLGKPEGSTFESICLVVLTCFNHLETYEFVNGKDYPYIMENSQWEGLSHILWNIKDVWNHQPAICWVPSASSVNPQTRCIVHVADAKSLVHPRNQKQQNEGTRWYRTPAKLQGIASSSQLPPGFPRQNSWDSASLRGDPNNVIQYVAWVSICFYMCWLY